MSDPVRGLGAIEVDVRKFLEYVLDPSRADGKDGVFLGLLGFRESHAGDTAELAATYRRQASAAVDDGLVQIGGPTRYGMRCTIVVSVRGVDVHSGWLLEPGGVLRLVTPFSGFARRGKERG